MEILQELLTRTPEKRVVDVILGLFWTLVLVETDQGIQGGLAATQLQRDKKINGRPVIPRAGHLTSLSSRELGQFAFSDNPTEISIGMAAINASLPRQPVSWQVLNAAEYLRNHGRDKKVVVVGHFPFVDRIKADVGSLMVLELNPQEGDYPASAAPDLIPQADIVAITGMTLLNHTFEELIKLCPRQATRLLIGPSTPLSPLLYPYGVDILCGSVIDDPQQVKKMVAQGATMRQIHKAGGIRMVTQQCPPELARIESAL